MFRVLPFLVVVALAACSPSTPAASLTDETVSADANAASAQADTPAAPKAVPAELPAVIARVNGEPISKADFEKALRTIEANAGGPVPPDQRDRVYRDVLDQVIGYTLLIQETKTRKLTIPEADLDARIAQTRAQFPTPDAFTQALTQQGLTLADLRADTRNDLLVSQLMQVEVTPKVVVSAATVDEFYTNNPEQFQQPTRVRASHILIGFPENADQPTRQKARAQAADVLLQVKAGKDFAGLARQYSSDTGSAQQGGDLGFFQQGQMVPPFDAAAFAMQTGQTSELVETDFGLHIIRVVEREAARAVPLAEVRPQVLEYLEAQSRQEQTQKFVEMLKAKSTIDILM